MVITYSICAADDKFRAAVLLGNGGDTVKDFGKAADAVPVVGAIFGLALKAVGLDGLHCLDIILFLTASIWEFFEVVGDPSLEGVECKGVVAPVLDGKASPFLAEENPLGLGEQKGDVAGAYRLLNSINCMI